jgi:hypothetical protein
MPRGPRIMPARYPPAGAWPSQMRADMVAAFLDYRDTKALSLAVARGDAPPPNALRGKGRQREPVWNKDALESFVAPRLAPGQDDGGPIKDLAALVPSS